MLLETADIKKNDVLIFSENKFDLENNFKLINKKNLSKTIEKISFYDIGKYINSAVPKSLIVYRLLTNQQSFSATITKYGFLLSIDGVTELIYFDPIFAIKDIEQIKKTLNIDTFRFKIQQVGLSTLSKKGTTLDYTEIFSFDLSADEAIYQNDKVYAEAIFAFDISFPGDESLSSSETSTAFEDAKILADQSVSSGEPFIRAKVNDSERMIIENDGANDFEALHTTELKGKKVRKPLKKQLAEIDKELENYIHNNKEDEPVKSHSTIKEFLQKQKKTSKVSNTEFSVDEQNKIMNLFKSTSDLGSYLKERAKESFILRIEK